MAYTAPSAVTTGQAITATLYNTYVKDNILDHESRIVTNAATAAAASAAAGPVGVISAFAGSTAPTGWLLCDGLATHSTTTYAALFAIVAYTYGGSGGVFGVPDLRGRVIAGIDNMGGSDAGRLSWTNGLGYVGPSSKTTDAGSESVTLTEAQIPNHLHSIQQNWYGEGSLYNRDNDKFASGDAGGAGGVNGTNYRTVGTGYTGGGSSHSNMQPTITLNYIIKH